MHAYYRGTQQRNGHLPDQLVDFRSTGGYVVTPPSQVGGRPYAVVTSSRAPRHSTGRRPRAPRPAARAAALPAAPGHVTRRATSATWPAGWLRQQEGNRNEGLFWAANRAVEAGDTETLGKLATTAREAGLDDREIDRTIRSAQQGNRGSARPFAREQAVTGHGCHHPGLTSTGPPLRPPLQPAATRKPNRKGSPEHDRHR